MRSKLGNRDQWRSEDADSSRAGPSRQRGVQHGRWSDLGRVRKGLYISTAVITAIVVGGGLFVYAKARDFEDSIKTTQVNGLTGRQTYGAQNILVLGSQTRQGQRPGGFGASYDDSTDLSDNLILIHLDPTHTHATVMSIPRDYLVYKPACPQRQGIYGRTTSTINPAVSLEQIDGVMNQCGPSGAVTVVKQLTGIPIDHFVAFDFNSFRRMVDAFGGVEVCVPRGGYHDPYTSLNLSAGEHLVGYNTALAYVRTRHGVGNGGDLGRIELQQAFISSVIQKVNQKGLLANSSKLYHIAQIALGALVVDQGLGSVTQLLSMATSLRGLHASDVNLVTVPTLIYPPNNNWLEASQPEDDVLFQMVKQDQSWTGNLPTQPASTVKVQVLNGTGIPHLAAKTARELKKLGFDIVSTGDAPAAASTTVSYAGLAQADSAYTVVTALTSNPANPYYPVGDNTTGDDTLPDQVTHEGGPGVVTLTLGSDFGGINAPPPPRHHRKHPRPAQSGSTVTVQSRNAGANICSGLPPPNTAG